MRYLIQILVVLTISSCASLPIVINDAVKVAEAAEIGIEAVELGLETEEEYFERMKHEKERK